MKNPYSIKVVEWQKDNEDDIKVWVIDVIYIPERHQRIVYTMEGDFKITFKYPLD